MTKIISVYNTEQNLRCMNRTFAVQPVYCSEEKSIAFQFLVSGARIVRRYPLCAERTFFHHRGRVILGTPRSRITLAPVRLTKTFILVALFSFGWLERNPTPEMCFISLTGRQVAAAHSGNP